MQGLFRFFLRKTSGILSNFASKEVWFSWPMSRKDDEETNHSGEDSQLVSGISHSPSLEKSARHLSWADLTEEDEFEDQENKRKKLMPVDF
ncbi:hypothetical protein QN277_015297 [Acacia crassicarpa]|uniref:Uncharacterized protein n=1 Tax=Acacia crassicarpa TaxID=499986 RepID=A0AAE1KK45_9FABA|nr:hypothetical protein QN277_015297 [Acacia crassicarpa]